MTVKLESEAHEVKNLIWLDGDTPAERGKYQITIENTEAVNSNIKLLVKVDSFDLKVWRNFKKYASETYKIVAFRPYDPVPFKSLAYLEARIKRVDEEIKILENKRAELQS